jgi:hypothetical protein
MMPHRPGPKSCIEDDDADAADAAYMMLQQQQMKISPSLFET